jgi:drug/metabolite transporter (DMT)-like permease
LVALIEPVTGVVVAAVVLGQTLSAAEVLGGAAILVAAAVVQRPDRSAARGAAPTIVEPNAELEPLPIE